MNTRMIGKYSMKLPYQIKKYSYCHLSMVDIIDTDYKHVKRACKDLKKRSYLNIMMCMFIANQSLMSSRSRHAVYCASILFVFKWRIFSFISDDFFDMILSISNTGLLNESFICSSICINRANKFFTSKRSIKSYIC